MGKKCINGIGAVLILALLLALPVGTTLGRYVVEHEVGTFTLTVEPGTAGTSLERQPDTLAAAPAGGVSVPAPDTSEGPAPTPAALPAPSAPPAPADSAEGASAAQGHAGADTPETAPGPEPIP